MYWRMQLHPAMPGNAVRHAVESLAAGYIGLDFVSDTGDMLTIGQETLPDSQCDYWAFAHELDGGDQVLGIAHHLPFALVRVSGPYNYIRAVSPELRVWFRHFRRVDDVRYYGDLVTNAHQWERLTMTDTISPLRSPASQSYQLIE